ncbi:hypothetical protein, partial [Streptomyces calidiresistens]|uniref:hypothetical protein n=1 Tax=Streptomyces calidiresistens TaxID=1485586 RepID=UPI001E647D92
LGMAGMRMEGSLAYDVSPRSGAITPGVGPAGCRPVHAGETIEIGHGFALIAGRLGTTSPQKLRFDRFLRVGCNALIAPV